MNCFLYLSIWWQLKLLEKEKKEKKKLSIYHMILMLKYVEKSFNVFKFQHPLLHDLRFQKEKGKKRPKLKTNTHTHTHTHTHTQRHKDKNMRMKQSLQKQKDFGSNSGDHSKFDPLLYFHFWWIRLLFCHSCPVLAKSRTEHETGSPLIRLL